MDGENATGDVAQSEAAQQAEQQTARPVEVLAPEVVQRDEAADHASQDGANAPVQTDTEPTTSSTDGATPKRKRRARSVPVEVDVEAARAMIPKVEAVLISCDRPVQATRVAQLLGLLPMEQAADGGGTAEASQAREEHACATIAASVRELNQQLEQSGRAYRIELLSGGYRVMTLPEHADVVSKLHKVRVQSKLSRAAVETLAVIAYRQPMTRAELESIRGVSCGEVLRTLVERRLVTVKGRAEELGRPLIYGTTPQFLEHFGLTSIKDLPTAAEGLTG